MIRVSLAIVSDRDRARRGFLGFTLESLFRNSSVEHDVVIVSQDGDDQKFRDALARWPVRFVTMPEPFRFDDGATNLYRWLNAGARAAESEWLLGPCGDDSYFFPGWEKLLEAVQADCWRAGRAPHEVYTDRAAKLIWTPTIVETNPPNAANELRAHFGRDTELEIEVPHLSLKRPHAIEEHQLLEIAGMCGDAGVFDEDPLTRKRSHWAHTVQHRDLFWAVGGYGETPAWPHPHDLYLHDAYSKRGVVKRVVTGSRIGNLKVRVCASTRPPS
jgi:hypothetical protein